MKQINIIQFTPYYPPHIGGLEKVVEDIHYNWSYGTSIVVTSNIGIEKNKFSDEKIFIYPAINIVPNFPLPKFWKKEFWEVLQKVKKNISPQSRIITHTRFFLSSLIGAIVARKNNIDCIHIEHGSGYVVSGKKIIDVFSKIYDKSLGKLTIKLSRKVIAISRVGESFLKREFKVKNIYRWYRGFEDEMFQSGLEKKGDIHFLYIGRISALKRVEDLLICYTEGDFTNKLYIIGDGEKKEYLHKKYASEIIIFLGGKSHSEVQEFLRTYKNIVINPSGQEGLPTTVIEGLINKNIVIATDVGGTSEISNKEDLLLYKPGDIDTLQSYMSKVLKNYDNIVGKSFKSVIEKFSMKKSLENLYDIIS